jgi:hypothetical protein
MPLQNSNFIKERENGFNLMILASMRNQWLRTPLKYKALKIATDPLNGTMNYFLNSPRVQRVHAERVAIEHTAV